MDAIRADDLRLVAQGVAAGGGAGIVWFAVRRRISIIPAVAGPAIAFVIADRANKFPDDLHLGRRLAVAAGLVVLAAVFLFVRRHPAQARGVPAAALVSAIAVWTAVPETSVVLVIGGAIGALALLSFVGRPPTAGAGIALALAVEGAALVGFVPTDLRRAGAVACLGLFLWWPAGQLLRIAFSAVADLPGLEPGWWLLAAHVVLAFLAARWVGAAPDATSIRLVVIGALGTLTAAVCRPAATMER